LVVERRFEEALEPCAKPPRWRRTIPWRGANWHCLGLLGRDTTRWPRGSRRCESSYDVQQHQQQALAWSRWETMPPRRTLSLRPRPPRDNPVLLNNLAWLLATSPRADVRRGPEAVALAERAAEHTRRNEPVLLGTLAAAYAEAGQFDRAVAVAEEAISKAHAANQPDIAQRNQELLDLYRAGQPCRAPAVQDPAPSP
jgi:tetratricopeptide (TPR) repeat protein